MNRIAGRDIVLAYKLPQNIHFIERASKRYFIFPHILGNVHSWIYIVRNWCVGIAQLHDLVFIGDLRLFNTGKWEQLLIVLIGIIFTASRTTQREQGQAYQSVFCQVYLHCLLSLFL